MKKALPFILTLVMAISLTACGNSSRTQNSSAQSVISSSVQKEKSSALSESSSAVSQNSPGNQSSSTSGSNGESAASKGSADAVKNVRVRFSFNNESIVVDMNDSPTSRGFLSQLPLTLTFKDYSGSEKIAYPPKELSTQGAPAGSDPSIGDLALFAPWGDIVLYYGDAGYYEGIVKMGHVESGIEKLANMKGDFTVKIERIN